MTLIEWTKDTLKDGIELWQDEWIKQKKTGVALRRDVSKLRTICLGVVSCDTVEEWYKICRLTCPVGTVIEGLEVNKAEWTSLYDDTVTLVRNELTKSLLRERSMKSAKVLLEVLSRRDKSHWAEQKGEKSISVTDPSKSIDIKFTVVD